MFISDESIKSFMSLNYNKTVLTITQLDGYNNLNFKLQIVDGNSDKHSGYETVILKIMSERVDIIRFQHGMMNYLSEKGINTSRPIKTAEGSPVCKITGSKNRCEDTLIEFVAGVLTFIPGVTFRCAGHPVTLMEDVGRLAGRVDKLLQNFERDYPKDVETLWELSRAPEVETFLDKYCSKDLKDLGLNVVNGFKTQIVPVLDSFQKGYIHGDINDCNIIVLHSNGAPKNNVISGLIDYGDACASFYVYEIATLMADLMAVCLNKMNPLEVGRLVLKGYLLEFELNPAELRCLRIVICVRMVQYLALGAEVAAEDPTNEYASLDIDAYLDVCKFLWNLSDEQFKTDVLDAVT